MAERARIAILPAELADQIAAGEVIERPSSVVKELTENALDAGARKIEVAIEKGGLGRIRVTDDGFGMTPDEAHLSLRRHATSKLSVIDDLYRLSTMGFRGEALPSIASVSHLRIITRASDAPANEGGYQIEVEAGRVIESRPVGAPVGTTIDVEQLLANIPARLKFLKSQATETGHVVDTLVRLALAFPHVHFRLTIEGRTHLDLPPHSSLVERAIAALGRNGRKVVLQGGSGEEGGVKVEVLLAPPSESVTTSRGAYHFVNQRFIRDRGLMQAVSLGYDGMIDRGRFPLSVVRLELRGSEVDVNVHPQKLEVRFQKSQEVYSAVRHVVRDAVSSASWFHAHVELPGYSLPSGRPPGASFGSDLGAFGSDLGATFGSDLGATFGSDLGASFGERPARYGEVPMPEAWRLFAPRNFDSGDLSAAEDGSERTTFATEPVGFYSALHYRGQLFRTHLLCEAPGELILIDQHAAYERVAYERLRLSHEQKAVRSQRLLLPVKVELDDTLRRIAEEESEFLYSLGFDVEPFGDRTLAVRAVPSVVGDRDPVEIVREILIDLENSRLDDAPRERSAAHEIERALQTLACHSAVRAGDLLGEPEVRKLLSDLDETAASAHCPHGRPVVVRISAAEIERRFAR